MDLPHGLAALLAGLAIAIITAPVGISGAVFLLPFQLSVLDVPSPAVTPTNLLFNVVATPGALLRYGRIGQLRNALAVQLLQGTVPGVLLGVVLRVFVFSGTSVFKLIAASVLLPLGVWLCVRSRRSVPAQDAPLSARRVVTLALVVGVVGGIYGVGGGSILAPILVGRGHPVALVAPAALASTFAASCVGALAYVLLSLVHAGDISPSWGLGLLSGCGGLLGGYMGAALQPSLPEPFLRRLLGLSAVAISAVYLWQVL